MISTCFDNPPIYVLEDTFSSAHGLWPVGVSHFFSATTSICPASGRTGNIR